MQVLNFECRPSLNLFTDLSQTTLELTLRVVHRDGSELKGPDVLSGMHAHARARNLITGRSAEAMLDRILAGDEPVGGRAAKQEARVRRTHGPLRSGSTPGQQEPPDGDGQQQQQRQGEQQQQEADGGGGDDDDDDGETDYESAAEDEPEEEEEAGGGSGDPDETINPTRQPKLPSPPPPPSLNAPAPVETFKEGCPIDRHVLLMSLRVAARQVPTDADHDTDGDVGKVRLCSDILDTLFHRAEISINQVCTHTDVRQLIPSAIVDGLANRSGRVQQHQELPHDAPTEGHRDARDARVPAQDAALLS